MMRILLQGLHKRGGEIDDLMSGIFGDIGLPKLVAKVSTATPTPTLTPTLT